MCECACARASVCVKCKYLQSPKRALDQLELESWAVVSLLTQSLGTELESFARAVHTFNCQTV